MAPERRRWTGDCSSMVGSSETPVESATEMVLFRRYGDGRSEDKGVPIACDCGHAVIVQTETDPLNQGQQYFSCPYGSGLGCGFKRWWTHALVEEFEVLRSSKAKMQKTLDEAKEKNQELEDRVQAVEDDGTMEHNVIAANRKIAELTEKYDDLAAKYEWLEGEYYELRGFARNF